MIQTLKGVRKLVTSASMKQAVSEVRLPVPWGEMRGKVWGPDDGRPVLCLHGWADNCGTFDTLIPLLPKECKYVAVDLPGHGLSSHRAPGVFYTFPAYVADVRRVIDALQWTKFSIVGHSMGGNIGAMFSGLYPEMVDALVLLDSFGFFPTHPKDLPDVTREGIEQMMQLEKKKEEKKERVYTYEKAVERLRAANPSLSEQSARILLERGLTPADGVNRDEATLFLHGSGCNLASQIYGFLFTRDFRIHHKTLGRMSLEQCVEVQSRIQTQVLVVLAREGFEKMLTDPTSKDFTQPLLQGFRDRHAMVVSAPGDHHIHLNGPEAVAAVVSNFLQNKMAPGSPGCAELSPTAKL